MAVRVQFRRDTATAWSTTNPILAQGEVGYEYDTGRFKVGNGIQGWNSLAYSSGVTGPTGAANTLTIGSISSSTSAGASITGTAPASGIGAPSGIGGIPKFCPSCSAGGRPAKSRRYSSNLGSGTIAPVCTKPPTNRPAWRSLCRCGIPKTHFQKHGRQFRQRSNALPCTR